jgi:predicted enzyme involved in methoxymalonyl-ACP biosynthesis
MDDTTELLDRLRSAVSEQRTPGPAVLQALAESDDPALVRKAGRLLAGLSPTDQTSRPVRVAVLATCTIGPFEHVLRASLVARGLLPTLQLGGYGTFELSLTSGAFAQDDDPDFVVCLVDDGFFLPHDWNAVDSAGLAEHLHQRFVEWRGLVLGSLRHTSGTLLLHTVPVPAELRENVISWRARAAILRAWHRLNADILELSENDSRIMVADLAGELTSLPFQARDDRLHKYADLPYTDGALLALARQVARAVQAKTGLSRKVLALDLDNTLWGGVLGEVGVEGLQLGGLYPGKCYQDLQRTALRLRDQGVILVLASKNDSPHVDEVLTGHPEVLLRPRRRTCATPPKR